VIRMVSGLKSSFTEQVLLPSPQVTRVTGLEEEWLRRLAKFTDVESVEERARAIWLTADKCFGYITPTFDFYSVRLFVSRPEGIGPVVNPVRSEHGSIVVDDRNIELNKWYPVELGKREYLVRSRTRGVIEVYEVSG